MNREDQFVITISRQFGTGGHEIGAELARRLDVKLLDKQMTEQSMIRPHETCSRPRLKPSDRLQPRSRV